MSRLLHRPRADEALIPCAPARPQSAPHLSGSHADRDVSFDDMDRFDGMPAGWRSGREHAELGDGYGRRVIGFLRAADTSWAALGTRRPVAPTAPQPVAPRPLPGIATIAYLSAVSVAIRIDHAVHQDTLHVIDDIRTLLDGRPELLAPFADAVKAGEAS